MKSYKISFNNICIGSIFTYYGVYFIKTSVNNPINAINLETGKPVKIEKSLVIDYIPHGEITFNRL